MVNYCCIQGCNRNSRIHKHLNFYSLPKERNRQKLWLKLARRDDLLSKDMDKLRKTLRFCSRHFSPNNVINRHLSQDAMPTKSLPGSTDEDEPDILPEKHEGIICDSCQDPILGFRYKCVTCDNYDLCQKCEMLERHPQHYMLRIAKSIGFQLADDLINKWRNLFKSEHITANCDISSDDEPVTKYIRNYDSGVDLSEDVKKNIKNEVARALKAVKRKVKKAPPKDANVKTPTLKRKEDIVDAIPSKKPKIDNKEETHMGETETAPEVVFEDVNSSEVNLKFGQVDVKPETAVTVNVPNQSIIVQTQPLLYVTLSNDLSQLMIELAQDDNANGNQTDVIKMTSEHL